MCRHGQGPQGRGDAVLLNSCTTSELLQLRQCCELLMLSISDRLDALSSRKLDDNSLRSACTEKERSLPAQVSAALLTCSPTGSPRSPSAGPGITAQHLDSDLGLWQALPQELFPSKRSLKHQSNFSSREGSQQPISPSMLSVTTAPSESGTIGLGRPPTEPFSSHSSSRVVPNMALAPARDPCLHPPCYTPRQDVETGNLSDKLNEAVTSPISAIITGDPADLQQPSAACPSRTVGDAPHPGIPVGGAALNAVPECNSSLETPDSNGLTHTSSRMLKGAQSVVPCNSILESFRESAAEPMMTTVQDSPHSPADFSSSNSVCSASYRDRGSSASSIQSKRSQCRRKGGGDAVPMVQYGFQSPRLSQPAASAGNVADPTPLTHGSGVEQPKLAVGTGAPRKCGLLSASLSQCASNCTSPHAVSPTVLAPSMGLPSKLAGLSFSQQAFDASTSPPRSSIRSQNEGSLGKPSFLAVPSCSPIAVYCEGSEPCCEPTLATASAASANGTSPVSAVIPAPLQMQMVCMGYHRPSRVLTEGKRSC